MASTDGRYLVSASACADEAIATCVLVTAVAQNAQADDGNLSLNCEKITTTYTEYGAKGGNVEFEWKVEEGEVTND